MAISSHTICSLCGPRACLTMIAILLSLAWCPMAFSASQDPIVVDVLFGEPIPMDAMLDDLATVKAIYLGEIHTIARHHQVQTELVRRLSARGVKLALGMEMFNVDQQAMLDRWQKSRAGLRELAKELGEEKWTNLKDYQGLITTARRLGVPILGLNAPDPLVRKVARQGLESLSQTEMAQVPPDVTNINPQYDKLLRMRLQVHKAFKDRALDNIVIAQSLRDATMARTAFTYLESVEGRDRAMLIVAGSGHMNYGFGIPERLEMLRPTPHRIVIQSESGELVLSEFEKKHSVPVNIRHEDLRFIRSPISDYLLLKPPKEAPDDDDSGEATGPLAGHLPE